MIRILSFDVTQPAQLGEKCAPCASPARFGKLGRRDCRMEDRYTVLRCGPLRAHSKRPSSSRAAEKCDELAPLHCRPRGSRNDMILA